MAGNVASPHPKVTIVTPAYMRAGFIRMCLDSVVAQEYSNIEHIVVDGGSTDGTVQILREYEESHGLRWVSEPDRGMYDAINKGLELATGEIVAYLNTDDAYFPWSVRVAVEALRDTHTDAVYGDLLVVRNPPNDMGSLVQFYEPFDLFHYTFISSIGQPTMFWRRDAGRRLGPFSLDYQLIADCEYWLRMGSRGLTLHHVPEVLAIQLEHDETLRDTQGDKWSRESSRLRDEYGRDSSRRGVRLRRLRAKMNWRLSNARLLWLWATGQHDRWPLFLAFLRDRAVPFPVAYAILSPLPGPLRRHFHVGIIPNDAVQSYLFGGRLGGSAAHAATHVAREHDPSSGFPGKG